MEVIDIVIRSIKNDGSRFRPSDWIERISSTVQTYHHNLPNTHSKSNQNHQHTIPNIQIKARPCVIDGEKCFVVNSDLAEINPIAYDFIMKFAHSNNLSMKKNTTRVGAKSNFKEFEEFQYVAYDS